MLAKSRKTIAQTNKQLASKHSNISQETIKSVPNTSEPKFKPEIDTQGNLLKYLKTNPKNGYVIEIFKSPIMDMNVFKAIISIIMDPQRHSLLQRLLKIKPTNPQISTLWGIIASRWILWDSPPKCYSLTQIFKGHLNLIKPEAWIQQLDHQNSRECASTIHQLKQADVLTVEVCLKAMEIVCLTTDRKSMNSVWALLSTFHLNEYYANRTIFALCNANDVDKAMRLVEKYGKRLNQSALIQVVFMLLKRKMELLAEQLVPLLDGTDKRTQNVILNIYSRTNFGKMMQHFNKMEKDVVSLGTVLNANGNEMNIDRMLKTYRENHHLKSEVILNLLCRNLSSRGYISQVKEIMKDFVQAGVAPTEHTISILMQGFHQSKHNQEEYIEQLIHTHKVRKGELYYVTLLQMYSDGNPRLLQVMEQMSAAKVKPQYLSLVNILKGATALKQWDIVNHTITQLYKYKISQKHLILFFKAAKGSKDLNIVQQIMRYIKKSRHRMDIEMYEHALDCYANQPQIIPDILTTILADFTPTDHIFNYLLDYDFKCDYKNVRLKQQTFQKLLRKLESGHLTAFIDYKRQYQPTADDYSAVMKAVEGDDLVQVVEFFIESDLEPTPEIKEQILRLKDIKELESIITLYNEIN
ncbi:hypothetical protein HDV01_006375 [Terramyces sp. JEL0728]|nr:hypothetical protein HDV01_006375 [Terramyces sp. JEL0728]